MNLQLSSERLKGILDAMDGSPLLRAKFLNTLSFMEHIGATKIARSQSGEQADFMTLKHAAEEARHAFYLKKLSLKIEPLALPSYEAAYLMAPLASRQYLYRLDVAVARMVKKAGLQGAELRKLAYLLVTFAIEVRADLLYPIYESYLERYPERISVSSIIAEEEGHLAEMESELAKYPQNLQALRNEALKVEEMLFEDWLLAIEQELKVDALQNA